LLQRYVKPAINSLVQQQIKCSASQDVLTHNRLALFVFVWQPLHQQKLWRKSLKNWDWERELSACGAGYKKHEQENLGARFEEIETIVDEKFEFLKELFERNQETCENQIKKIGGKFGNLEKRFEEMQKKFDERNEENAKEMREIKRMLEKMTSAKWKFQINL
jgi:hypothetical protein